jgi:hypothetical protein
VGDAVNWKILQPVSKNAARKRNRKLCFLFMMNPLVGDGYFRKFLLEVIEY